MSIAIQESVLKSIAFIEANLQSDIGVRDVADAVSYSQFYFSREFSKHTHISIYDYILRRKISESYKDLFRMKSKIVDLAYKYGFQSHEVYTRAFRKVFAENPSDASVFKPLAVYEAIDSRYLDFLHGLKLEKPDASQSGVLANCFFDVHTLSNLNEENSQLVLLQEENFLNCKVKLGGKLRFSENQFLSIKLSGLQHKIRIYHNDAELSFRYFTNYIYDADELGSNYILIRKEKDFIDFLVPCKPNG